MIKPARRFLADRLLVRTGLRDWLARHLLPTEWAVTRLLLGRLRASGLTREDVRLSMIVSAHDDPGPPSPRLIALALTAAEECRTVSLDEVLARFSPNAVYTRTAAIWPGEHYRFLAALVKLLRPRLVIEIGTAEGGATLVMTQFLPPDGRLVTFDLVPWQRYPNAHLTEADFADGRLQQLAADLSDPSVFAAHAELFAQADLIFLDAAKDGQLERTLLRHFETVRFAAPPIFVLDDIRLWNMIHIWNEIRRPKLDVTSFAHWSGTGLIDWTPQ
jgi:predicted O-methyltransferase YrrM